MARLVATLMVVGLFVTFPSHAQAQYTGFTHVIPQVADGTLPDGSGYISLFFITKMDPSGIVVTCSLNLFGMSNSRLYETSISMPAAGNGYVTSTRADQPFVRGYAVVSCNGRVAVNTVYLASNSTGIVGSMATVFSQGPVTAASLAAIQYLPTTRLGIAIANNSSVPVTYTVTVNIAGTLIGKQFTLAAQSSQAQFLDEILSMPGGGPQSIMVYIQSSQPLSATGLLFIGSEFTTIPLTIYQ